MPPKFVRPCIPLTAKAIPKGDAWVHEPKLDGYRFQIVKNDRAVRFYSRRGNEWTKWLPNFAAAFQGLRCRSAVLDGELVVPDDRGAPSFYRLHASVRIEPPELVFFAFDILHRDGADLTSLPLLERRRRLVRLVGRADIPCLHLVQGFDNGVTLLEGSTQLPIYAITARPRLVAPRDPLRHPCPTAAAAS